MGTYCLKHRDTIEEDKKVLEVDGGDGCTTMWMHLIPQNYAF